MKGKRGKLTQTSFPGLRAHSLRLFFCGHHLVAQQLQWPSTPASSSWQICVWLWGTDSTRSTFLEPGFFVWLFLIMPDRFSNPLNTWPSCHCGSTEGPAEVNYKALPPKHLLRSKVKQSRLQQLWFKNITWSGAVTQITKLSLHHSSSVLCLNTLYFNSTISQQHSPTNTVHSSKGRPVMNEKLDIILHWVQKTIEKGEEPSVLRSHLSIFNLTD